MMTPKSNSRWLNICTPQFTAAFLVEIHNRNFSSLSIADIKFVPFSRKGKTGSYHRLPATIPMFSDLLVLVERGDIKSGLCGRWRRENMAEKLQFR